MSKRILYYAPLSFGGVHIYAQEQADALGRLGIEVTVLCSPAFTKRPQDQYALLPLLIDTKRKAGACKLSRMVRYVWVLLRNLATLRKSVKAGNFTKVLFVSYAEYFAPLWAAPFRRLAMQGVEFGAVVQEPIRNNQVGPLWWHRWSIYSAYSFLRYAFEHDEIELDTVRPVPGLKTAIIPMGAHVYPDPLESAQATRKRLGISENSIVVLAFGHIRDGKNLDFAVAALKDIPLMHLIVAGTRNSSSQKPESYYIELARKLGVENRCTWMFEYVTEDEGANLFNAADLILLTYSSSFHSASGVLNVAARYRKPCIASSGAGSLRNVVTKYNLGIWVQPDDARAVADGIKEWIKHPPKGLWDDYNRDNSWSRNAEIVSRAMGLKQACE